MSKKIAIFTTFYEATSGYSLIGVTETQIKNLLDHGYDPMVLVQQNFFEPAEPTIWSRHMIDLRMVIPALNLTEGVADDFDKRVDRIRMALEENLREVDVLITQDIIAQKFYKEHNAALRQYAKTRDDLLILNWIHSCPSRGNTKDYPHNLLHVPPPGYIVYPNRNDVARVCAAYGLQGRESKVIVSRSGHAIDPMVMWNYSSITRSLAKKADLLNGDMVAVYPARLDRGKQPEKILYLLAGVKQAGYEPRLLIIDWQSAGERFQRYIDELNSLARDLDIADCVFFSSRLDDSCSQGVPRHVVTELMDLSTVYIHPSAVETYSLVVHEAALRGLLLVLNYDFPPMAELFGEIAIYMDFESDRTNRRYPGGIRSFFEEEALRLISEFKSNRTIMARAKARRDWSPKALWKEFEPLFYLTPIGE